MTAFGTIARLAWRESRTARRRLLLYMSSISLGVAALVAIDSFANNVQTSIREQSRSILGGDVMFSSNAKFPAPLDQALDSIAALGNPVARVVTFGSMALVPRSGGTRLVQVKGISANWPLYGDIVTEPEGVWTLLDKGAFAVVDPGLLISLDARVGDTLSIGYAKFRILGTITSVPGDPGVAAAIGPRVYIPSRFLPETQLLGFGSRASYEATVRLPPKTVSAKWVAPLRPRFQKENVRVVTVTQREQSLTEDIGRLADFLGIVGLIALLLGGIGVASGVNAFVSRKIDTVAVLRCLGATSAQVLAIYVLQAAAMGLVGAAIGTALGVGIQFVLPLAIKDFLPIDVRVALDLPAIALGLGIGVWVALVFALRPLLVVRRVSPLQALRRDAEALERQRLRDVPSHLVNLALLASVLLLAIQRAGSFPRGVAFAGGIGASMLVLWMSASGLSWLARRVVTARFPYVVRQGVANLYRPANQTRSVVLALGFGAFLVSTLYIVQANLLRQFDVTAEKSKGNLILFDIQEDQRPGVDSILRAAGQTALGYAPIVTMKIAAINGRTPVEWASTHGLPPNHWSLRREFRSTYRDTMVATEKLVAGRWFGHATLPDSLSELSLEQDIATQLKVGVGSVITWDVQGVRVSSRITSLREVNWGRFEPNFFAVFEPKALVRAPKQFATVANVAADTTIARIQRATVTRYPNVSSLDLSLVRRTLAQIVSKVAMAVRFLTLFSLAMGIPVLFSAVAATRRDRLREGVLLKTLGATRAQIGRILLAEYLLLGTLGALAGMVLSFGGAWTIVTFVFDGTFQPAVLPAALIALTMMALAVGIGFLTGRDVFRETPMAALREA
ncbi:MAG: ABC transporter permease [Gemmatimonadetes bacterium]|nr:ABC transporter permease [Gemmatimonadota bacterium]